MYRLKTRSIWPAAKERFYRFLDYTNKFNLEKNILIIGCSDGTYVFPAAIRGFKVFGIDIDKEALYGSDDIEIDGKKRKYLGLEKRIEIEGLSDNIKFEATDFMKLDNKEKYSLVFSSGMIHYMYNSIYTLEDMLNKMISFLDINGVLLLEYISKDENTDNTRHFYLKEDFDNLLKNRDDIRIISHISKTYEEKPNIRDNKVHVITWNRLYVQRVK